MKGALSGRSAICGGERKQMIYWCPVVRCTNKQAPCFQNQIFLPLPIQLEISVSHPDWPPPEWKAFVVCRECGHLCEYSEPDVQWGASPDLGLWEQNSFLRTELKCNDENCESPVIVHMFAKKGIPQKMKK